MQSNVEVIPLLPPKNGILAVAFTSTLELDHSYAGPAPDITEEYTPSGSTSLEHN